MPTGETPNAGMDYPDRAAHLAAVRSGLSMSKAAPRVRHALPQRSLRARHIHIPGVQSDRLPQRLGRRLEDRLRDVVIISAIRNVDM